MQGRAGFPLRGGGLQLHHLRAGHGVEELQRLFGAEQSQRPQRGHRLVSVHGLEELLLFLAQPCVLQRVERVLRGEDVEALHVTAEQLAAYKAGELYVNVHSPTHKGGEIRAQLKP